MLELPKDDTVGSCDISTVPSFRSLSKLKVRPACSFYSFRTGQGTQHLADGVAFSEEGAIQPRRLLSMNGNLCQTGRLELDPQNLHSGRRKPTPENRPLTYTRILDTKLKKKKQKPTPMLSSMPYFVGSSFVILTQPFLKHP